MTKGKVSCLSVMVLAIGFVFGPSNVSVVQADGHYSRSTPLVQLAQSDQVRRGKKLSARLGCAACHSFDGGERAGPTWKGLFGSERPLADGTTVVADQDYIHRSIKEPNVHLARGFMPDLMPQDFGEKLSDEDLIAIVEFMKTLR